MYQIFKDFSGPVTTLAAALTAVYVTWHFSAEQARVARAKLRLELFEKRYAVYDAARNFLAEVARNGDATEENWRAYVVGTGDATTLV